MFQFALYSFGTEIFSQEQRGRSTKPFVCCQDHRCTEPYLLSSVLLHGALLRYSDILLPFNCLLLLNFLVWGILSSSTLQRCIKHEPLFEWKDSGHLLKAFVFVCVYVCYLRATYGVTAADMHWARAAGQLMSTVNICGLGLTVILHFDSCDVWSANFESRMCYLGGCSGLPYVRGGVNEDVETII